MSKYADGVGTRISRLRVRLGMGSQGRLAEALGTDASRVSTWENERVSVRVSWLRAMAELTNQPDEVFLWLTDGGDIPSFSGKAHGGAGGMTVRESAPPVYGRVGRAADARERAENIRRLIATAEQGLDQFTGFFRELIGAAARECYQLEQQDRADGKPPVAPGAQEIAAVVERVQQEQARKSGGKPRKRRAE